LRNKRAIKVLAIFTGTIATILLSMMALSAIYEDELVDYLKYKINNSLITPLNIEKTSVSIFDDFPSISIKLTNLSLNDTLNNRLFEVIKARQVVFSFDLISLLRKEILMKSASATDVVFNHLIDKNGEKHSVKFKTIKDKSGAALDISIPKITLTNVKIHITNEFKEKEGSIVHGVIHKSERNGVLVKIQDNLAFLPTSLSIPNEKYVIGFEDSLVGFKSLKQHTDFIYIFDNEHVFKCNDCFLFNDYSVFFD
jgi:uncharacterized protein involved in outer membrane biogenesis